MGIFNTYSKQWYANNQILYNMKVHIFRVKKANEFIGKSSIKKIEELVLSLVDLDANIKIEKMDPIIGIETFLLQVIK